MCSQGAPRRWGSLSPVAGTFFTCCSLFLALPIVALPSLPPMTRPCLSSSSTSQPLSLRIVSLPFSCCVFRLKYSFSASSSTFYSSHTFFFQSTVFLSFVWSKLFPNVLAFPHFSIFTCSNVVLLTLMRLPSQFRSPAQFCPSIEQSRARTTSIGEKTV
jgi:hypothetical protein